MDTQFGKILSLAISREDPLVEGNRDNGSLPVIWNPDRLDLGAGRGDRESESLFLNWRREEEE